MHIDFSAYFAGNITRWKFLDKDKKFRFAFCADLLTSARAQSENTAVNMKNKTPHDIKDKKDMNDGR
jgi:hypothetical protein